MTQEETERYNKAVLEWEKHKRHIYLWFHDDITFSDLIKSIDLKTIGIFLKVWIICSVAIGLLLSIVTHKILSTLIGTGVFFLICAILIALVNFFLALNYVEVDDVYPQLILCGLIFGASYYFGKFNIYYGIIAGVIVFLLGIKVFKSAFYEECNKRPRVQDFDSEYIEQQRIYEEEEKERERVNGIKKIIVDNWDKIVESIDEPTVKLLLKGSKAESTYSVLYVIHENEDSANKMLDLNYRNVLTSAITRYAGEPIEYKMGFYKDDRLYEED